ncbi:MAG: NUDIX hydrolase [Phycisphaeraceae bacterium]
MPRNNWKQSEKLLEGVRFDVYRVGYPRRDGGVNHREVVVPADAVVILPWLDEHTLVLIRNERPSVGETLWELPAGTLEEGEDPGECAERELAEETGYRPGQVERMTEFYTTPGFCTEKMFAYRATGLEHVGQDLDATEHIEVEKVTPGEALKMIADGRIRDGKTIAVLLLDLQQPEGKC